MNTQETNNATRKYRPQLAFYHPNAKGTGGAVKFELVPACGDGDGCIFLRAANQMSIGNFKGPTPVYARFDWENAIPVKLGFDDLCKMLQVFRGECEVVNDGKGLHHRTLRGLTRIVLRHTMEPVRGYFLELYNTNKEKGERHARIMFGDSEALGLCAAISGSLAVIGFGIPEVVGLEERSYVRREVQDEIGD